MQVKILMDLLNKTSHIYEFLSSIIKREKQQSQNCHLERSYVVVVITVISLNCCLCFAYTVILVSINI